MYVVQRHNVVSAVGEILFICILNCDTSESN